LSSTIVLLREELEEIQQKLEELVKISPVRYHDRHGGPFVIVGPPDYYFEKPIESQLRLQVDLKARYTQWYERFLLIYHEPPSEVEKKIKKAHDQISSWIELDRNHQITMNCEQNALESRRPFDSFFGLLDLLNDGEGVIVIPDTNALITTPDPEDYQSVAERRDYIFMLMPTVLTELDRLSHFDRNEHLRDKAKKVISRIKGWRNQGSLTSGVTVHKTVTVTAVAKEPDMENSLGWLDREIMDDRIIASVLEIQNTHPSMAVILVTSDINLQNKAEAAKLPCAETPRQIPLEKND